jgi:hypothetical protein
MTPPLIVLLRSAADALDAINKNDLAQAVRIAATKLEAPAK